MKMSRDLTSVLYIIGGIGISFTANSSPGTLVFEQLLQEYGSSRAATAWVFSLNSMFVFSMVCLPAMLTKRFSFRTIIVTGGILRFTGILLSSFMPSIAYIYVSYGIIAAFGDTLTTDPMLIAVTQHFFKKRGWAMSICVSGESVGGLVFPPLVQMMFEYYGYSGTMMVISAITLHLCLFGSLYRPLPASQKKNKGNDEMKRICTQETEQNNWKEIIEKSSVTATVITPPVANKGIHVSGSGQECYNRVLDQDKYNKQVYVLHDRKRTLLIGKVKQCCCFLCTFPFVSFAVLQIMVPIGMKSTRTFIAGLALDRGVTLMQGSYLVSLTAGMELFSKIFVGKIYDFRFLRDKRSYVYSVIGIIVGVATALMPLSNSFASLAVIVAFSSLFNGCFNSQYATVLGELIGAEHLPEGMSINGIFKGVGAVVGLVIPGMMRDIMGSYDYAFYGSGFLVSFFSFLFACVLTYSRYCKKNENRTIKADETEYEMKITTEAK